MEVIDILQNKYYKEQYLDTIESYIKSHPHRMNENYYNMRERMDSYEVFNIVLENGIITSSGGLRRQDEYPAGFYRTLDRGFLFDRNKTAKERWKNSKTNPSSLMFEYQANYAKNKGFNGIFISEEFRRKKILKQVAKSCDGKTNRLKLLDDFYCVCYSKSPLCWHKIALYKLTNATFNAEKITEEQYILKFKKVKNEYI